MYVSQIFWSQHMSGLNKNSHWGSFLWHSCPFVKYLCWLGINHPPIECLCTLRPYENFLARRVFYNNIGICFNLSLKYLGISAVLLWHRTSATFFEGILTRTFGTNRSCRGFGVSESLGPLSVRLLCRSWSNHSKIPWIWHSDIAKPLLTRHPSVWGESPLVCSGLLPLSGVHGRPKVVSGCSKILFRFHMSCIYSV